MEDVNVSRAPGSLSPYLYADIIVKLSIISFFNALNGMVTSDNLSAPAIVHEFSIDINNPIVLFFRY